jgi:hypothetical protein
LAIVVSSRESCCAKTTFAKGHDGRPLGYESGRLIHHSVGHDLDFAANWPAQRAPIRENMGRNELRTSLVER